MKALFLSIIFFATIISCKKTNSPTEIIEPCPVVENLDSASTSQKLVGTWLWRKQACMLVPLRDADKEVKVKFSSTGNFTVTENSIVVAQGTWVIRSVGTNKWRLNLSSYSSYLAGFVGFCNNQVEFDERIIDGCLHIFTRVT
ncbi:MAG: hypothetical protein ABIW38_07715 [Ferruginibacter sp.]